MFFAASCTLLQGSSDNTPTVADAGADQYVESGTLVTLDASLSSGSGELAFDWTFVSKPSQSSASLPGPYSENQSFVADADGTYVISLSVSDSSGKTSHDEVAINASRTFKAVFGALLDDDAKSVQPTKDNGYILAGYTDSFGAGARDVYLIKTDEEGRVLWKRTFGGANNDTAWSVVQSEDYGYAVVGQTYSYGAGDGDVYVIKTDPMGNELWTKTFGNAGMDTAYHVEETSDHGFIVAGVSLSTAGNGEDAYLIRLDSLGNTIWAKTFGGDGDESALSVRETLDNGYVFTGYTSSSGAGDKDVYVLKTDSDGNELWSRTYGGANLDEGKSVSLTHDGGLVVAGDTASFGAGLGDAYMIKTDGDGALLWSTVFGGAQVDSADAIRETADSGFVVAGTSSSMGAGLDDAFLVKTDQNGNVLWTRTFGGERGDSAVDVELATDGGYVVAGGTYSLGAGAEDIFFIKTDQMGSVHQ